MKRTLRWRAVAALALAIVVGTASAAAAKPSPGAQAGGVSSVARTSDGRAVTSEAVTDDVVAYWTPERMAAAVNLDFVKGKEIPAPSSQDRKPNGPPSGMEPAAPTVAHSNGLDALAVDPSNPTAVGKVFVTLPDGRPGQCSAGAVNSPKKRLVLTAAHCVFTGRWHTNFTFVPSYNNGFRPHGTWVASELNARAAWLNAGDYREDFAFAIMNTNNAGQRLGDVVGGHGWWVNIAYSNNVIAYGYPANFNNGETLQYCQSPTQVFSDQRIWMGCNMAVGASGGPWLYNYDPARRVGWVNGVGSQSNAVGVYTSSYFDNDFRDLYNYAESRSPF